MEVVPAREGSRSRGEGVSSHLATAGPGGCNRESSPGGLGLATSWSCSPGSGKAPAWRPRRAHTCSCTCPAGVAGLVSAQGLSPAGLLCRAVCVPGDAGVHQEADWLRRGCSTELRPPTQRGQRGGAANLDARRSYASFLPRHPCGFRHRRRSRERCKCEVTPAPARSRETQRDHARPSSSPERGPAPASPV